jgi:GT2 family glycosyltransferase
MPLVAPTKIIEVELGRSLAPLGGAADEPSRYRAAFVLVRLHGDPLGVLGIGLHNGELDVATLVEEIRRHLGQGISEHLKRDGATGEVRFDERGCLDAPSRCGHAQLRDEWPLASVIVCTRDRPRALEACIKSLLPMTHRRFEVVVVDSAPTTDAAREVVERYAGESVTVRYVREREPGLARARNRGLVVAAGDHVAFTDDDVVVDADWLSELTGALDVTSRVTCATGLSLPAELETAPQVWFEQFGGFNKGFDRRVFDFGSHRGVEPLHPYRLGWYGSGLNMAFDAASLRALGGFDEHLGAGSRVHGGEDLDAFMRVIRAGQRLAYEPRALVWHFHRRELQALKRQVHGSGAGLSAVVAKLLLDPPTRRDALVRAWPGLRHLLAPSSPKNRNKMPGFPRGLTFAERRGLAIGPFLYVYSLWRDSPRERIFE